MQKVPKALYLLVPEGGIEPPLPFGNRILNPARLPVPPPRLASTGGAQTRLPQAGRRTVYARFGEVARVQKKFAVCDPFWAIGI